MRRRRIGWLLLGLVLTALAALGALLLRPGAPGPVDGADVRRAGASEPEQAALGARAARAPALAGGAGPRRLARHPILRCVLAEPEARRPGARIVVQAVDRSGNPFGPTLERAPGPAGAALDIDPQPLLEQDGLASLHVTVRALGRLCGTYEVTAAELAQAPGGVLTLNLSEECEAAAVVRGRVVNEAGQPLEGMQIVWGPAFDARIDVGIERVARSGPDGLFEATVTPRPRGVLVAWAGVSEPAGPQAGWLAAVAGPHDLPGGGQWDAGALTCRRGETLRVRVIGAECSEGEASAWPICSDLRRGARAWAALGCACGDGCLQTIVPLWRATDGLRLATGLAAGSVHLAFQPPATFDGGHFVSRHIEALHKSRVVTVPGPTLELDLRCARLHVVGSEPGAWLEVESTEERGAFPVASVPQGSNTPPIGEHPLLLRFAPHSRVRLRSWMRGRYGPAMDAQLGADGSLSSIRMPAPDPAPSPPPAAEDPWFVESAGALRVAFHYLTDLSLPVPARVRVEDAQGRLVPTRWRDSLNGVCWLTDGALLGLADCLTALPEGAYVLVTQAEGFLPLRTELSIPAATPSRPVQELVLTLTPL